MTDPDPLADDLERAAGNLPDPAPRRPPPVEHGKRLATIARGISGDEELRIVWAEYEGKPFLSLRLWRRDGNGGWWPDPKRGLSVRVRELRDFATGVAAALREASSGREG